MRPHTLSCGDLSGNETGAEAKKEERKGGARAPGTSGPWNCRAIGHALQGLSGSVCSGIHPSSSPPASFHPICSWKKICWGLTVTSGVLADAPPLWFLKLWAPRQTQYWQWNQGDMLSVVGDSHQPLLLESRQAQSYPPGKGTRISSWW